MSLVIEETSTGLRPEYRLPAKNLIRVPEVKPFVWDDELLKGLGVAWVGQNFKNNYHNKYQEGAQEGEIAIHEIPQSMSYDWILHNVINREVSPAQLKYFLEQQAKGEPGVLLVNGGANNILVGKLWMHCHFRAHSLRTWAIEVYDSRSMPPRNGDSHFLRIKQSVS